MGSGVSLSNKNCGRIVVSGRQGGFQETTIIWKGPPRQKGQDNNYSPSILLKFKSPLKQ